MNFTDITVKSAPPAVLAAWSFVGFTLNEWAAIAAITYSVLMIFFLLSDRFTKWRKERNEPSE
jgi:membrane protein insertase Oxa1/YidC/SpoIIIJ